jgi:hypothetical protein
MRSRCGAAGEELDRAGEIAIDGKISPSECGSVRRVLRARLCLDPAEMEGDERGIGILGGERGPGDLGEEGEV